MNQKQLSEHIGNMDDKLVQQAEIIPNYTAWHRHKRLRRLLATAATLALMAASFSVGAIAFARETVIEVPVEQEQVVLEEIGLTLILPDSWKGKYVVIEDTFAPFNSTMWEFCMKSAYDAQTPIIEDESGELVYRGTLFYILQRTDYGMTAKEYYEEFYEGIEMNRYLFATDNATYEIMYTTDVQYDTTNPDLVDEWNTLEHSEKDIRVVIDNIFN